MVGSRDDGSDGDGDGGSAFPIVDVAVDGTNDCTHRSNETTR